jgi:NRAMP (natural resistance-associated macrophage protein)-like metal ion transporter
MSMRAPSDPPPADAARVTAPRKKIWQILGPGLITGASDDDPSGIGTYSQVGAQFGFGMLWTMLFSFPLMAAVQLICARIGRVTGRGIAGNLRQYYPPAVLLPMVSLLLIANTINIAADLGAMGAALQLLAGGPTLFYTALFGVLSLVLQVYIPYSRYVSILRWLTLALLAYVATVFSVHVPWGRVALATVLPKLSLKPEYITAVVAIFGTTISPYLFFWQASQEVEDQEAAGDESPLLQAPAQARAQFERMEIDTYAGMGISNLVGFFIILTAALSLYLHGVHDIGTAAEAAAALRPIAGPFAFVVFSIGIIGTGMLAVPVLAGSAAYGVAEALGWTFGLELKASKARKFYAVIAAAILVGVALNMAAVDPIKALFWTAVINGVVAVPLIVVILLMSAQERVMGQFAISRRLKFMGWLRAPIWAAGAAGMFATWPNR